MKKICKPLFRTVCSFWYVCLNYFGRGRNHCFLNKSKEKLKGFPHWKKPSGILPSEEIVKKQFTLEDFLYAAGVWYSPSITEWAIGSSWDQHNSISWISPPSSIELKMKTNTLLLLGNYIQLRITYIETIDQPQ